MSSSTKVGVKTRRATALAKEKGEQEDVHPSPDSSVEAQKPVAKKPKTKHQSDAGEEINHDAEAPQETRSTKKQDCMSLLMVLGEPSSSRNAIMDALTELNEKLSSDEEKAKRKSGSDSRNEIVHLVCSGLYPLLFSAMEKYKLDLAIQSVVIELLDLVVEELKGNQKNDLLRVLPNFGFVVHIFRLLKLDDVDEYTSCLALKVVSALFTINPKDVLYRLHGEHALVIPVLCNLSGGGDYAAVMALQFSGRIIRYDHCRGSLYKIGEKFQAAGIVSRAAKLFDDDSEADLHSAAEKVLKAAFGKHKVKNKKLDPLKLEKDMKSRDCLVESLSDISNAGENTNEMATWCATNHLAKQMFVPRLWIKTASNNSTKTSFALYIISAGALYTLQEFVRKHPNIPKQKWRIVDILHGMSAYLDPWLLPGSLEATMELIPSILKEFKIEKLAESYELHLSGFRTYLNLLKRSPEEFKDDVLSLFRKCDIVSVAIQTLDQTLYDWISCMNIQSVIFDLIVATVAADNAMKASWMTANALTRISNAAESYQGKPDIQSKAEAAWNALSPTFNGAAPR